MPQLTRSPSSTMSTANGPASGTASASMPASGPTAAPTPVPAAASEAAWLQLKAAGNAAFKQRQYVQAQRSYEQAIRALKEEMDGAGSGTVTPSSAAAAAAATASASTSLSSALSILHSNLSATHFQLGSFAASLAAADDAIAADPSFLKARMRRALALEQMAATGAGAGAGTKGESTGGALVADEQRRVMQLQEAMNTVQKIAQIMKSSTGDGAPSTAPAAASLPSQSEVNSTLVRLRSSLASLHSRAASPLPYLQVLRACGSPSSGTDADPAAAPAMSPLAALRGLMRLLTSSGAAKAEALGAGLLDCLLRIAVVEQSQASVSMRTRAAAVRAIRHLLATDMANAPASGAAASNSQLDLQPVREAAPALLQLFESMRALQSSQAQQVPPPLPPVTAALGAMLRALCTLLATMAVHPRFEHAFTVQVCSTLQSALPRFSTHSPAALASLWKGAAGSTGAQSVRLCISAIDAITYVASSPFVPSGLLKPVRAAWLPLLLLEPAAQLAHEGGDVHGSVGSSQLRASILAAVSVLTRNAMPRLGAANNAAMATAHAAIKSMAPGLASAFGPSATSHSDLSEEQQKELEAEGLEIREQMLRVLYAPLMNVIQPAPQSSTSPDPAAAAASIPVQLHFAQATRLLRGLSLLLQSNSQLGTFIVTFGATKEMDKGAALDAAPTAAEERKEEERKRADSSEEKKADDVAPAAAATNSSATAAAAAAPTVLQLLLSLSSFVSAPLVSNAPPKSLQLLSAEVLALSSSDTTIRHTLGQLAQQPDAHKSAEELAMEAELREEGIEPEATAGRGADIFMDLIVQYTDRSIVEAGSATAATRTSTAPSDSVNPVSNQIIVAHACLALSKLVAVGEWGSVPDSIPRPAAAASAATSDSDAPTDGSDDTPDAQGTPEFALLLHILLRLIETQQRFIPRVEREAEKEEALRAKQAARERKRRAKSATPGSNGEEEEEDEEEDDASSAESSERAHALQVLLLCFESLSYVSLHSYAKSWLVADSDGHGLKLLISIASGTAPAGHASLGVLSDRTVRYALLHVFRNLCTSRASLASTHNAEIESLKKMASKGLHNSGTSAALNEEQNARQELLAGKAELISVLMRAFCAWKGVAGMVQLFKGYTVEQQELDSKASAVPSATTTAAAATPNAPSSTPSRSPSVLSPPLANAFAFALLQLSTIIENRGLMIQQGAVRLLLDLYALAPKPLPGSGGSSSSGGADETLSSNSPQSPYRCALDCLSALARLFISTNPALVSHPLLKSTALVLLEGLSEAEHELLIFESLMALTNIASFVPGGQGAAGEEAGNEMAEFICAGAARAKSNTPATAAASPAPRAVPLPSSAPAASSSPLNGWYLSKSLLASSNPMVQRAAVELMTNLVNTRWVRERLRAVPAELAAARGDKVLAVEHDKSLREEMANPGRTQSEDLRLLCAFALSDDLPTARAATGALAMLSVDPLIAARIAATRIVSYVPINAGGGATQQGVEEAVDVDTSLHPAHAPPEGSRAIVRNGITLARQILRDPGTHPDVKLRVQALQDNMEAVQK